VDGLGGHVRHHARFYATALLGLAVWSILPGRAPSLRLVLAGDTFFAAYLASSALVGLPATPEDLRRRARYEDEGILVIIFLTLLAISLCLAALFALLAESGVPATPRLVLAVASVVLGWFTLHTVAAFRYAHLYYAPWTPDEAGQAGGGTARRDVGGLAFPETPEPGTWDFLYYAFVIGMTSQVSDVPTESTEMRRTTLAHSITAFFFNAVILALTINIAASYLH
jgi:uncharacterized membrane protein